MKINRILIISLLFSVGCMINISAAEKARLKEIARIQGVRSNQLMGMGLVIGLAGTGDKAALTPQMLNNLINYFGNDVGRDQIKSSNVATVMVTAELPAFKREGDTIDVTVSSLNDAKSLDGGILLQTPLKGADGSIYSVAQGALVKVTNRTTNRVNGSIPNGAIVEKEVPVELEYKDKVIVILNSPDFTTASRVVDALNERFSYDSAKALDAARIEVRKTYTFGDDIVSFISAIENLEVSADRKSIIVINEKTGTIILGDNIMIAPVAISQGNINITIAAQTDVTKAYPENSLTTTPALDTKQSNAKEDSKKVKTFYFKGTTVKDVVKMLNAAGASPDDIISILQALKSAGSIDSEIKIM